MFILILDSYKRIRKFMDSMSKDERKRLKYVLVTDTDMEGLEAVIPKKADFKVMQVLIPPQDLALKKILDKVDKKDFQEEYYRYLTRPMCRAALTKIAKYAVFENRDVVVCFGLVEIDMNIPKYIIRVLESMFPDLTIFTYKDWKNDPSSLINYNPDNIGTISMQISDYSDQLGRKMLEMESCKDRYSRHEFYDD